ncbi:D-alanine--D-alanine ligase family protein [Subtercola boreus]|uniref:D-alanine--D-alanine ligase n=1 Tax=Subtercola boreus TaxID=120213 RepID=A0A3E0WFY3_9MICO|nr:D-alanine--D-alanine ligase [Subtercola boreus]RFA23437.1 D-alanine--D-alanine ligase [Subtercola boreus]RFA23830.1 D-alanine--D-alanine ligase [Subtercola boreus]RFA29531.1 D-alanine--D-alanine ligase [Subtercola boreus]
MTDTREIRTVVVLAGGISHEREVSLRSGRRVADSLLTRGHRVIMREPDGSLLAYLTETSPDLVWPALHGASGEDGSLRALLDAQGVAYVGSEAAAAQLAWHKPTAKVLVSRAGYRTPDSITLPRETFRELGASQVLDGVLKHLGTPVVVKPAMGGSAQGVTVVETEADLPRAVVDAYTYGETALIERKVSGTEISVGVIDTGDGPFALPAVEIVPRSGVYSFEARYNAGETQFYTPARIDDASAARAGEAALAIHLALGLRHISRIDLIIDSDGLPWFLEANVLPGLTETSLVPQGILAAGLDLGSVYEALGEVAIRDAR